MNEFDFNDSLVYGAAADAMSQPQAAEVAMNESVLTSQMRYKATAEGRSWLDFNPNAGSAVVAFAGSVNEGQPMDRNKYLAAVDSIARDWSADADGYNYETLVEMAVMEAWVDGAEEMFGPDVTKEHARGLVKKRVEEVMRRTHAFAPVSGDHDVVKMNEIEQAIDAEGKKRDLSDFSSDARLLKKYVEVKKNTILDGFNKLSGNPGEDTVYAYKGDAAKDKDLYNRFMGRGWRYNRKMKKAEEVESKKWREQWWEETQDGQEHPKDEAGWQEVFRNNAKGFAAWYREHAVQEAENYSERYHLAARTEIMRRLGDARARGKDVNERKIIMDVLAGGYDDEWHWPSVLTEEDVARAEERRMKCIEERRKEFSTQAARARSEIGGLRDTVAAKKEAAALAKEQEAERKAAEKAAAKQKKEQEEAKAAEQAKAAKALELLRKNGTPKVVSGWGYDGRGKYDEPEACRVHKAKLAEVRKQLNVAEDEVVYVQLKVRGKSAILLPVVADYSGDDYGVMLNARAQEVLTRSGKKGKWDPDAEGDGEVVFKVAKKSK